MSDSFDVFLSHNSEDKPAVRQLTQALKAEGLQVWLDEEQLVPGQPWREALEEIIQTTRTAAVLVGKDGLGPWEKPEMQGCLSEFVDRHLPVIPVLLPDAPAKPELPLFLRAFTWVDLRGGLTEDGLKRLVWGITGSKEQRQMKKAELKKLADQHELSQSYEEAIEKWKMIHDLDPEDPDAEKQIERLNGKLQYKNRLQNYKKYLLSKAPNIGFDVATRVLEFLKKVTQTGKLERIEDEIGLSIIEQFVNGNTARDFVANWEGWEKETPAPGGQQPNYSILAERLNQGEIILFLGSDIPRLSGITKFDMEKLVEGLATRADFKGFTGTLSMIAQYYEMDGHGRRALIRNLRNLIEEENIPEINLYKLLARIERPLVLISAAYDMFLENCFQTAGKKYVLISSVIRNRDDCRIGNSVRSVKIGDVIVRYSDQKEAEVLKGEALSNLKDLKDYSLIYKIRGYCDNPEQEIGQDIWTLTEENYFDFARNIERSIPNYIVKQFINRVVYFVGYSTKHWEDRLLVSFILHLTQYESAKVITQTKDSFEIAYWNWKVKGIYPVDLENFVAQLEEQLEVYFK